MPFAKQVLVLLCVVTCVIAVTPAQAAPTRAERALIAEMNRTRAAHGLAPLRLDLTLERAARAHSRTMIRTGTFAHGSFQRRLASFGARGPAVGENLGWGVGWNASARGIVAAWLASPSHRANLLRPGFRRVGVGRLVGTFAGHGGAAVVTADFAGR
jgi:uncharacterized protein YkwD